MLPLVHLLPRPLFNRHTAVMKISSVNEDLSLAEFECMAQASKESASAAVFIMTTKHQAPSKMATVEMRFHAQMLPVERCNGSESVVTKHLFSINLPTYRSPGIFWYLRIWGSFQLRGRKKEAARGSMKTSPMTTLT